MSAEPASNGLKKAKTFSLKMFDLLNLSTAICLDVPIGLLSGSVRSRGRRLPSPAHRGARGHCSGCRAEHPRVPPRSALGSSTIERDTILYFKSWLKIPRFGEASPARFCKSPFTCQAESGACLGAGRFNKKIFG